MEITYAHIIKQGEREINEDCIGTTHKDESILFTLADGLGGHGMGDKASKTAVTVSLATYDSNQLAPKKILEECFKNSQNEILKIQEDLEEKDGIKTTLVNLLIEKDVAYWGHIGDSRLYVFRKGKLFCRTADHSVPQMLFMVGDIKEKEIRSHIDRNKLLRVLGIKWDKPKYDIYDKPILIKKGDTFLLCSDGFWEWIDEKMMTKLLRQSSTVHQWLNLMEQSIIHAGKDNNMDNYSAIAVFVD